MNSSGGNIPGRVQASSEDSRTDGARARRGGKEGRKAATGAISAMITSITASTLSTPPYSLPSPCTAAAIYAAVIPRGSICDENKQRLAPITPGSPRGEWGWGKADDVFRVIYF